MRKKDIIDIKYLKIAPKIYKLEIFTENMMNGIKDSLIVGFTIDGNYATPTYFGSSTMGDEITNPFQCSLLCFNIFYPGVSFLN